MSPEGRRETKQVPYSALYAAMLRIRTFEERVRSEYAMGAIAGWTHSYVGEEAIAAGVCLNLREVDYITSTHRGHGHCIAKGVDMGRMAAELLGRSTGLCKGKGGSMHMADFELGVLGANGMVGGGLGIACGAGLSAKLRETDQVTVAFFGDGATAQGIFYEALNLSAVWDLPVVFVCENNQYAEACPFFYHSAVPRVSDRAKAHDMPGVTVDGMDVLAVHAATQTAIVRAREGMGPTLFEAQTYRFHGHSGGDAQRYKPEREADSWRARDPISTFRRSILENEWLGEDELTEIDRQVVDEVETAWEFAYESPLPEPSQTYTDVYVSY